MFTETQEFHQTTFRSMQSLRARILYGAYAQFGGGNRKGDANGRKYSHGIEFTLLVEASDVIMYRGTAFDFFTITLNRISTN